MKSSDYVLQGLRQITIAMEFLERDANTLDYFSVNALRDPIYRMLAMMSLYAMQDRIKHQISILSKHDGEQLLEDLRRHLARVNDLIDQQGPQEFTVDKLQMRVSFGLDRSGTSELVH